MMVVYPEYEDLVHAMQRSIKSIHADDIKRMSKVEKRKSSSDLGFQPMGHRSLSGSRKSQVVADSPVLSNAMDRSSMLLVEANEISQYLHLDYVFTKGNSGISNDEIKVLDMKQNISCTWSIAKFKEKLIKIRKLMYLEDSENSKKFIAMNVLFDPDDSLVHELNEKDLVQELEPASINKSHHASSIISSSVKDRNPSLSDAADSGGSEITDSNNRACSPPIPQSSSFSSLPHSADKSKDRHHPPDKHLPIRSLSTRELRSADKSDGLPDKYFTGSSDEEIKKTVLRSAGARITATPRIKGPVHVYRNPSLGPSSLRPYTGQRQSASLQHRDAEVQTEEPLMVLHEMSTFRLCKDLTTMTLARFSYCNMAATTVDRILCVCESIRQGVRHMQATLSSLKSCDLNDRSYLSQYVMESSEVEKISVQITISLEVLIAYMHTWCTLLYGPNDSVLVEQQQSLLHTLKELTKDIVTLWQSCEKEVSDIVNDSVAKILNLLQQLCVECGKIAVTLGICPQTLSDQKKASLEQIISQKATRLDVRDLLNAQPGLEVKCSFLAGCDIVVDRSLQQCLQSADDIRSQIKSFSDLCESNSSQSKGELFQLVCNVITASRTIFVQLQQVQIELYSKMNEDAGADKPTDYYHYYFERCISMVNESQKLVDGLELLKLAVQPLQNAELDGGVLRKISRCAEMAQRSAGRLLQSSCSLRNPPADGNTNCNFPAARVLFPSNETHLDEAQAELVHSTNALCGSIKDKLDNDFADETPSCADKVRRLLPVTPSRIQIMRCQSANICDQRTILSKQFSLCNFCPRGTELRNVHWNK